VTAQGRIFVVSSPSGGGKSSIIAKVLDQVPRLVLAVSHTSRPPRKSERSGVDYHFVSHAEFLTMKGKGEFVEWVRLHGNLYGTSRGELERLTAKGRDIILDIDIRGAASVAKIFPEAVTVFVLPPSMKVLEERLRKRESESEGQIRIRLERAVKEMQSASRYRYCIVNKSLSKAAAGLEAIVTAERLRLTPAVAKDLVRNIISPAK